MISIPLQVPISDCYVLFQQIQPCLFIHTQYLFAKHCFKNKRTIKHLQQILYSTSER